MQHEPDPNCHDNVVAESFFSTMKNELTLQRRCTTRDGARAQIFDYIEMFYNPVRHLQETLFLKRGYHLARTGLCHLTWMPREA
jgi:hypothetical protein